MSPDTHQPILNDGILNGRVAARIVRAEVKAEIARLGELGIHPRLVVVRVGDDPASERYVRSKVRASGWVGLRSDVVHLPADTNDEALAAVITSLNDDDDVDGILVQLPLPGGTESKQVLNLIRADKDVDAFHPYNLGALLAGRGPLEPCTPSGIMRLLELGGYDVEGKRTVVVGRSAIVGRPMAGILLRASATVTVCHRHTRGLAEHVSQADLVISATGVAQLIKGDWIKPGAWVIDVGMGRLPDGSLCGDVEFDVARQRAHAITPVPGGVGPMTVAMLLHNTVVVAKLRRDLTVFTVQRG